VDRLLQGDVQWRRCVCAVETRAEGGARGCRGEYCGRAVGSGVEEVMGRAR
jgi:hypothetical protein